MYLHLLSIIKYFIIDLDLVLFLLSKNGVYNKHLTKTPGFTFQDKITFWYQMIMSAVRILVELQKEPRAYNEYVTEIVEILLNFIYVFVKTNPKRAFKM